MLTLREKWERRGKDPKLQSDLSLNTIPFTLKTLEYPWQIWQFNDEELRRDFDLISGFGGGASLSSDSTFISPENIFIEEGAVIRHAILNASTGPIYISKNTEIMEGTCIRGPFFLGEGSVLKMGTRIYGATSIGKYCVIGGEVKNSVFFDYSNKSHDGYIGDSVIGSWCNLGAGTSNSNLKNTASPVKVWDQAGGEFVEAGTKCGLLMGDYSRSAINSSINTGTVTGICCHVFGSVFTPKHIPSFSWGLEGEKYEWNKVVHDISNWKKMKNRTLTEMEIQNLRTIFENT
jgi:UDP-N-acetylglucosamine diphosphorylase/glucosamine-1-phosphate N-acetyltransferase